MHWDDEPDWHPSPCPLPARRGEGGRRPGEGRFMGKGNLQNPDMNRSHEPVAIPSTALRAPSPPLGEKDGLRGHGSWKASFRFCTRIGTINHPPHPPFGHPLPLRGGEGEGEGAVHGR